MLNHCTRLYQAMQKVGASVANELGLCNCVLSTLQDFRPFYLPNLHTSLFCNKYSKFGNTPVSRFRAPHQFSGLPCTSSCGGFLKLFVNVCSLGSGPVATPLLQRMLQKVGLLAFPACTTRLCLNLNKSHCEWQSMDFEFLTSKDSKYGSTLENLPGRGNNKWDLQTSNLGPLDRTLLALTLPSLDCIGHASALTFLGMFRVLEQGCAC